MKKSQIKVGAKYVAKVNGDYTTVIVESIDERPATKYRKAGTVYSVTNTATGRLLTFKSAMKFLRESKTLGEHYKSGGIGGGGNEKAEKKDPPSSLSDRLRESSKPVGPHVIVEARAGTGKTTTLVEGLKRVKGIDSDITPSPQQAAVWEEMEKSQGAKSICFAAFNKSIATELQERVPEGCEAMTMHSMGYKAVQSAFGRVRVSSWRVQDILSELLEKDIRELKKNDMALVIAVESLVGLCKQNLAFTYLETDPRHTREGHLTKEEIDERLMSLASHYDVELNGSADKVFSLVPRVLERCKDVQKDGAIDFNDMVWLPVVLNLPIPRYDLLLVDEAQDLNRCQQAIAKKAGKRLVFCGDPKQAIYGFAGADAESMERIERELGETEAGVVHLPLTVTRRCGKAIVEEAKQLVPDFEAHEGNGEGVVEEAAFGSEDTDWDKTYRAQVQYGDMVLCRVNAPLVSECFRFIRKGVKANIQGRDVGKGLIRIIKKLKANNIGDLIMKLSDWKHEESKKEMAKRNPSENRLIAIQDRYECLQCFIDGSDTINDVIKKIEEVFTDDKDGQGIVMFSSIHKAKGLEADNVYLLLTENAQIPHPMAKSSWQIDQEYNLLYVGITRAIKRLVRVS